MEIKLYPGKYRNAAQIIDLANIAMQIGVGVYAEEPCCCPFFSLSVFSSAQTQDR